jgi:hypothetical protein
MRKQAVISAFFPLEAIEWVPRKLAVSDRHQTHPLTAGSVHQARPNCTVRPDPGCTQNHLLKSTKLPLHKTTETLALSIENSAQDRPIRIDRNSPRLRYYILRGGGTNRTSAPLASETQKVPVRLLGTRFEARNCICEPGPYEPYWNICLHILSCWWISGQLVMFSVEGFQKYWYHVKTCLNTFQMSTNVMGFQ